MKYADLPIESLINLGPKSGQWIREAGITTIAELERVGPVFAFRHSETLEEHVVYRQEYTSQQTETFEDAMRIKEYYEKRWLIEEYHKSLKTGCQLEARQYETSERLEAIAGFLSIVAVRLLQLKSVARTEPSRQVKDLLPWHWIEVLQTLRKHPR